MAGKRPGLTEALTRKLRANTALDDDDLAAIARLPFTAAQLPAGAVIANE